jgi:isoquinoline 1-oxidoreductase
MTRDALHPESAEPERYELSEAPLYHFDLDRREFVAIVGAGILVTMTTRVSLAQDRRSSSSSTVGQRLHIGTDGTITVLTGKVEVGQGSRTQITMAAAEELRVKVESIRLVMADSAEVPDDGGTSGSRTTPSTIPRVRSACAAARELLRKKAAELWKVEVEGVSVSDGKITGPSTGQITSYGDLVREHPEEILEGEVDDDVALTPTSEWRVLGTTAPRVDGEAIVTGAHRYPSDIVREGMLYGKVLRPPAFGATLEEIDLSATEAMKGVVAVRDASFVGFAAPTSFAAMQAIEAVAPTATWKKVEQPSGKDLYAHLRENVTRGRSRSRRPRVRTEGSVEEGFASAKKTLRETYHVAYIQHAPMEPRAAVAEWNPAGLTVWTGTQAPSRVHQELAEAFRLSADKVRVIVPDTGGGFGGKHTGEAAVEAARLAKAAGKPVSLQWTREEEFTWAYFRPAGVIDVAAGLSADGSIVAWEQMAYNCGSSAIETPYGVPNTRTELKECDAPLRSGSYRALASTANNFARESFMDEIAATGGLDSLELRRRLLTEERLRNVLEAAAERFGWKERRKSTAGSKTRGIGLACGTEKDSFVAACVEIEIDPATGRFRVVEICEAFECGAIQNPGNLRAQVEGCIIQGLGGALTEEILFEAGRILNPSFSTYRVPRLKDVPRIETVLVDRPDLPSVGAGETPIIAVAPAIANALFAATGVRIRSLPIRNEKLQVV